MLFQCIFETDFLIINYWRWNVCAFYGCEWVLLLLLLLFLPLTRSQLYFARYRHVLSDSITSTQFTIGVKWCILTLNLVWLCSILNNIHTDSFSRQKKNKIYMNLNFISLLWKCSDQRWSEHYTTSRSFSFSLQHNIFNSFHKRRKDEEKEKKIRNC